MDEAEIEQVFGELLEALRANGLQWVAEQVGREIAAGKPEQKKLRAVAAYVPPEDDIEVFTSERRAGRSVEFTHVRPFTAQEKLELLIGTIETVGVAPALMQETIASVLPSGTYEVVFAPEEDGPEIRLAAKDEGRRERAKTLELHLKGLRTDSHGDQSGTA